jgi:nitrate reductase beta subunit
MRGWNIRGEGDPAMAEAVVMTMDDVAHMYRQVAIADYNDRYVLPKAHGEVSPGPSPTRARAASTSSPSAASWRCRSTCPSC